jgi:hypothetical protein
MHAVWEGEGGVYYYDIALGETHSLGAGIQPRISGDTVVWQGPGGELNDSDIYLAIIPEPTAFALLGGALLAAGCRRTSLR